MIVTPRQERNFWRHVAIGDADICWPWRGTLHKDGYGIFTLNREADGKYIHVLAHRVAAFLSDLVIDGLLVCHRCDNPPCCNPDHLFVGTQIDNMTDCANKGRAPRRDGEHNGNAVLRSAEILEIRTLLADGFSLYSVAKAYGVGWTTVSHIRDGDSWPHLPLDPKRRL